MKIELDESTLNSICITICILFLVFYAIDCQKKLAAHDQQQQTQEEPTL